MFLKGAAILTACGALCVASADMFECHVVSTFGDLPFTAAANYWAGGVNQILPTHSPSITTPSTIAALTVISEGNALGNYYFAGQNWLTFAGTVQWIGQADPNAHLRVTSQITDLDHNVNYVMLSNLDYTGSNWAHDLVFSLPTRHVRWTDQIELVTGWNGTLVRWDSTNHTMNMIQGVPEPCALLTLSAFAFLARKRRK